MKKTIIYLIITASIFYSCGSKNENKNSSGETATTTTANVTIEENNPESLVKNLTYKKFIKEVWDMEKYPDSFAYQNKLPCIIDFYADWCGPCRKVAPIMEKLANQYEGRLIVYKVNTDEERKLSSILNIKSIPTVFFLPTEGQPVIQVGAMSEADYVATINKYLLK